MSRSGHIESGPGGFSHGVAMVVERGSDIGDVNRARRALQQADAEPLLEIGDPSAHARLGNAQSPRGAGEASVRDNGCKKCKIVQIIQRGYAPMFAGPFYP
ncbi:hypothetical protein SSBR45G_15770 [Bradyrhizobium sp. SSBR45G]|nr:hypothetical protein SSBR45G_15770 [Bradyrhizobium sp. SSBR45G]